MTSAVPTIFECLQLGASLATPISIWIAYQAYQANLTKQNDDRSREADKELLAQCKESLAWAYGSLTNNGNSIPPVADRLNWLTSSRHILRYLKIREKIGTETYCIVVDEIEEYWRHKFYLALDSNTLLSTNYFTNKDNTSWPENIEISSAMVIIEFSNWKKGTADPTDAVDREKMKADGTCFKGLAGRGLRHYIQRINDSRDLMNSPMQSSSREPGE